MMFTFGHYVVQAHFCGNFTHSFFYHKMIVVIVLCTTVLSQASTHTRASAHPPILTVLWFFEVLCVTTHHAKFLRIESEGRSAELTCTCSCDCALGATTSGIKVLHTPLHGLVRSVLSLQHEICILQAMTECCGNLATRLRVSQLCSTIQLSPWLASTKHEVTMRYTLAVYFASGVGPCMGIFEPFKHLLCVTAHPQLLVLELQVPMGACSGQYGKYRLW